MGLGMPPVVAAPVVVGLGPAWGAVGGGRGAGHDVVDRHIAEIGETVLQVCAHRRTGWTFGIMRCRPRRVERRWCGPLWMEG